MSAVRHLRVVERDASTTDPERRPRALVAASDARLVQAIARVVHAVGAELAHAGGLDEVPRVLAAETVDVLVCDVSDDVSTLEALASLALPAPPKVVLLNAHLIRPSLAELLNKLGERHLIARVAGETMLDVRSILVTLRKLLDRDLFGAEKYLCFGAEVHKRRVTGTRDKPDAIQGLRRFLEQLEVDSRMQAQMLTVADELITNAIFNAPVDGNGNRRHASRSRREIVALDDSEAAAFEYMSDGRLLAVACRDSFGSFEVARAHECLARAMKGGVVTASTKEGGGAGIGLTMVYQAVDELVVNIHKGHATEVFGIVDLAQGFRARRERPKSVNVFSLG